MGVNGLWTVIQPCARPTNLATLNRKRLAVDASIWIYQFLKAVRDKEGNALRNSHVVGFFRRICKLLWFGIQPVFVFDGGAPALKRATIQGRQRRREGRREDAVRTAGKLLAVQMQRIAEEEDDRRKREGSVALREEALQHEEAPDPNNVVYVDEIGMSQNERTQNRSFRKQDAYHLPELDGGIAAMGKPDDPRIMSVEELEDYARQFHNGEDVNLYDFSKIDFDGDFFKSLPAADRYNILNAARLRSRLRMGYSKDQLDDMFPDRMAFSRFQIERVKERNHLTQKLMHEAGMTGLDLTIGGGVSRVAGDKDREYILVKNDGAEGGWALGVVSKERDIGEAHKPIDVDAIDVHFQAKDEVDEDDEDDFEDIPIEGLNRLPKPTSSVSMAMRTSSAPARRPYTVQDRSHAIGAEEPEDSLFVGGDSMNVDAPAEMHPEEQDDLEKAIAMSLRTQHAQDEDNSDDEDQEFEDVEAPAPEWKQKAVEGPKPISSTRGSMIAHIVNNRANASVPKRQEETAPAPAPKPAQADEDSESDTDMQAVLAKSRKMKKKQPPPVAQNKKNPFDGPLPFPKLDWGSSLFSKKADDKPATAGDEPNADDDEFAGGFEKVDDDKPKPLPPWLVDDTDIRESVKKQQEVDREINFQDRLEAEEDERLRRKEGRGGIVEIEDDSDNGSDVMIVEAPSPKKLTHGEKSEEETSRPSDVVSTKATTPEVEQGFMEVAVPIESPSNVVEDEHTDRFSTQSNGQQASPSPEPEFEDVALPESKTTPQPSITEPSKEMPSESPAESPEPVFEDIVPSEPVRTTEPAAEAAPVEPATEAEPELQIDFTNDVAPPTGPEPIQSSVDAPAAELFEDVEYDEFSDPGDEELLVSLAEEAEEHARFASELNQKSTRQNKEDYEKELRQLRTQQKKDRRDADEVSQVMVTECQALLRLFGIPYITAPMEAEAQCAELVKLGLVDGIVTDDSDTFLFGGTRVYKNMFNSNKFVECYVGSDMEKELSLSREQLISLAQLLGSDYTDGLQGVGPVTAVEILSEFPGKDGLSDFREWWHSVQNQTRPKEADAKSTFRRKFRKSQATKLFLPPTFPNPAVFDAYLHPEVDANAEPFQWGVPDVEGLRNFLMATIGWGKERTDEVLVPVIRDMNKREAEGTQSNITRFFGGGVGAGAREVFAPSENRRGLGSKRMAAAVDRLRENVGRDGKRRKGGGEAEGNEADAGTEVQEQTASAGSEPAKRGRGRKSKAT